MVLAPPGLVSAGLAEFGLERVKVGAVLEADVVFRSKLLVFVPLDAVLDACPYPEEAPFRGP